MTISGGPVFWLLVALAVAAVVIFFERFFELRRVQIDWQDFVKGVINVLGGGNAEEALAICEDTAVPVASVVATAIRHRDAGARVLREAVDSQGRAEISRLDRRLAALAIIGQISPLIGLLGTIIGFIKTVLLINSQELVARADLLNSSMEALLSAALGLGVAIPVAVMYGVLRVRMERIVVEMEAAASQITGYIATREAKK
ncbi:MAG: MotA/TolQ/ExbB proton channel family protein [Kiritimatiellae bacterium]|nr:MotA/TolQ/ExbB proton channel family protein [Kiritimatiellia bacterium]MCR5838974.1 MotA/TolQ/ExbB proton channel family protein [Kiritimatiellia bacterium]